MIQTAEEIYKQITGCVMNHGDIKLAMIEFAKKHVKAALEAASKQGGLIGYKKSNYSKKPRWKLIAKTEEVDLFSYSIQWKINKKSILNSYPNAKIY